MVTVVGRYGEMACHPLPPVFGLRPAGPPTPGRRPAGPPTPGLRPAGPPTPGLRPAVPSPLASLRGTHPRSRFAPGDLSRGLPGFPWTPVGGSATLASLTIGGSVRRWESPDRSRPGPRERGPRGRQRPAPTLVHREQSRPRADGGPGNRCPLPAPSGTPEPPVAQEEPPLGGSSSLTTIRLRSAGQGGQLLDATDVHLDPGAHGRRHGQTPDIAALGCGRLGPDQFGGNRGEVLQQLGHLERGLAHGDVDVAVPVVAVLDAATLELGDGLGDVGCDRAGLGVRHQATWTEDAPELSDLGHHVRRGDGDVEVELTPTLDGLDELRATDDVGACLGRLTLLVGGAEHGDTDGLAGSVGKGNRATHVLVGLPGVDVETERGIDGLVEVGRSQGLDELQRLGRGVRGVLVVARGGLAVLLACWHFLSLWSSRPSRASHYGSGLRPLRTWYLVLSTSISPRR